MKNENSENLPIVAITQGDINGISYEIILKTLADSRILELFTPIIYGSAKVISYYKKLLKLVNININLCKDAESAVEKRINLINCADDNIRVDIGKSTKIAGQAAYEALKCAVTDLKRGVVNIVVTAPINKHNINSEEFNFPGHTEYFEKEFEAQNVLMLMVADKLKIGVVTGHIPLNKISTELTIDKIVTKLHSLNNSLKLDFCLRKPIIAVLGLNPHAGDNGIIGNEEKDVIIPAIERANKEGIVALGPYPADGFFASDNIQKFDAVLAMYHDQGLIPFKILSAKQGVNFTTGLPIIRTSPAHGTAYDIAGNDVADFESFKEAIYLALDINRNRKILEGIEPLQVSHIELEK